MTPEAMLAEVDRLGPDLRFLCRPLQENARNLMTSADWRSIDSVILIGHGDSYKAVCAAEMAFRTLGGIVCEPVLAQHFVSYAADWIRVRGRRRPLLVAVSATGNTPRVVEAINLARRRGALTLALTASWGSDSARAADHALQFVLPDKQPSPGIRSFHAILAGLFTIAITLGEGRGHLGRPVADALRDEIANLAPIVDGVGRQTAEPCATIAALLADATIVTLAGTGPSFGVALYGAAKIIEATAVAAIGQDLEEWWHVERFMGPASLPLVVIAPSGQSAPRARELIQRARELGRLVIGVTNDRDIADRAAAAVHIGADVREAFSPLLYHPVAGLIAGHLALQLGRTPFDVPRMAPR